MAITGLMHGNYHDYFTFINRWFQLPKVRLWARMGFMFGQILSYVMGNVGMNEQHTAVFLPSKALKYNIVALTRK